MAAKNESFAEKDEDDGGMMYTDVTGLEVQEDEDLDNKEWGDMEWETESVDENAEDFEWTESEHVVSEGHSQEVRKRERAQSSIDSSDFNREVQSIMQRQDQEAGLLPKHMNKDGTYNHPEAGTYNSMLNVDGTHDDPDYDEAGLLKGRETGENLGAQGKSLRGHDLDPLGEYLGDDDGSEEMAAGHDDDDGGASGGVNSYSSG